MGGDVLLGTLSHALVVMSIGLMTKFKSRGERKRERYE